MEGYGKFWEQETRLTRCIKTKGVLWVYYLTMAVIHISEADAVRDFAGLLARVRTGAEVVIGSDEHPVAVIRSAVPPSVRRLSESLRLAKERASTVTLDADFANDLEAAINSHPEPSDSGAWD